MTTKPRPKRRSRPSLAVRLRAFWLLALVVAGLAAWGTYALVTWPAFHLQALTVTGLAHVDRAQIVARAAIDPHDNVWLIDRAAIERRLAAIPYVATAYVHRRPLGNVWIDVRERTAEACVRARGGAVATVDGDLRVLAGDCGGELPLTYVLRGRPDLAPGRFLRDPELVRLQSDARALAKNGDRFKALAHDAFGELDATMADGIRVRFGDDEDLDRKQRLIGPILAQLGVKAAAVRAVDLRAPATPVVEYRR